MKNIQVVGSGIQDIWKNFSVSRINRKSHSQSFDINISLSPNKGNQTTPPPPLKRKNTKTTRSSPSFSPLKNSKQTNTYIKYKVITLLEDYLEIFTLSEVEFGLIIIMHVSPALPSSCSNY